jgi:hypothetical protein
MSDMNDLTAGFLVDRAIGALNSGSRVSAVISSQSKPLKITDASTANGIVELTMKNGNVLHVRKSALLGVVVNDATDLEEDDD